MMESLRNFLTGPRLFIVVAACALPFVFLGTSSLTDTTGNSLGSINGENVTQADFQVATNLAIQKYKDIYGESFELSELSDEIQLEIIKQELIIQKTLLANARSMGFVNDHTRTLAKKILLLIMHSGLMALLTKMFLKLKLMLMVLQKKNILNKYHYYLQQTNSEAL